MKRATNVDDSLLHIKGIFCKTCGDMSRKGKIIKKLAWHTVKDDGSHIDNYCEEKNQNFRSLPRKRFGSAEVNFIGDYFSEYFAPQVRNKDKIVIHVKDKLAKQSELTDKTMAFFEKGKQYLSDGKSEKIVNLNWEDLYREKYIHL